MSSRLPPELRVSSSILASQVLDAVSYCNGYLRTETIQNKHAPVNVKGWHGPKGFVERPNRDCFTVIYNLHMIIPSGSKSCLTMRHAPCFAFTWRQKGSFDCRYCKGFLSHVTSLPALSNWR